MRNARLLAAGVAIAAVSIAIAPDSRAADLAAAKSNYTSFCLKCHGESGKGDGSAATTIQTKPRDFTDCARMKKESDEKLFNVIKNGGKANGLSADMQAWSQAFEDPEIKDLVAYIRTFCKQ